MYSLQNQSVLHNDVGCGTAIHVVPMSDMAFPGYEKKRKPLKISRIETSLHPDNLSFVAPAGFLRGAQVSLSFFSHGDKYDAKYTCRDRYVFVALRHRPLLSCDGAVLASQRLGKRHLLDEALPSLLCWLPVPGDPHSLARAHFLGLYKIPGLPKLSRQVAARLDWAWQP